MTIAREPRIQAQSMGRGSSGARRGWWLRNRQAGERAGQETERAQTHTDQECHAQPGPLPPLRTQERGRDQRGERGRKSRPDPPRAG